MCHRISPLLRAELEEALDMLHESGHARVPQRDSKVKVPDVYPGQQMPLFVADAGGGLAVATLTWGFDAPPGSRSKLLFNTRIETAVQHARTGRGLWAEAIQQGRCLVPVRGFYEHWTVSPPQRGVQVRFTLPRHRVFLLAGVQQDGRFSVVTTAPNADVATVHNRMPLVLGLGESHLWMGPEYAVLADRSGIALAGEVEDA